jgi:hypothetical protein
VVAIVGRGTALIAGSALVALAALAWLAAVNLRERRWFDRPDFARRRMFDPAARLIRWALLLAGLAVLWRASRLAALAASGLFAAAWGWRAALRSVAWRRFVLRRQFAVLRAGLPGVPDEEILERLVLGWHPEWGPELIAQMVHDYRTPEALARVIARMERGFRGFR